MNDTIRSFIIAQWRIRRARWCREYHGAKIPRWHKPALTEMQSAYVDSPLDEFAMVGKHPLLGGDAVDPFYKQRKQD